MTRLASKLGWVCPCRCRFGAPSTYLSLDAHDRPVTSLERDSFRIFEDNIEQEVREFVVEDVPVSIGVIFDLSGSMANKFSYAKKPAVNSSRLLIQMTKGF